MVVVGCVIFCVGIAYFFFTQDAPDGNFSELRAQGKLEEKEKVTGAYFQALSDYRVWALFLIYAACFGIELTINNVAALYFFDYFDGITLVTAGLIAASFGLMNIFARTLGGIFGDNFASLWGLKGRTFWLFVVLLGEGIALMLFSRVDVLFLAIPMLVIFSLFTQMSEGATYSVVPFINKRALGAVAGTVGAGGNAGAVAAGFLFKSDIPWNDAFLYLGMIVACASVLAFLVRFSPQQEEEEAALYEKAHLDGLELRAARAVEALNTSRAVVEEYNRTHTVKV